MVTCPENRHTTKHTIRSYIARWTLPATVPREEAQGERFRSMYYRSIIHHLLGQYQLRDNFGPARGLFVDFGIFKGLSHNQFLQSRVDILPGPNFSLKGHTAMCDSSERLFKY